MGKPVEFDVTDLLDRDDDFIDPEGTYRDKSNTINDDGSRKWIYPKKPSGKFHNWRAVVSAVLILLLVSAPFIEVNGHPFLQFDILGRKFVIFGMVFWPADFYLFMLGLLTLLVFVLLFTSIWGRVWCGWTCPQTVFMEMVFRKIEYWIEGDAAKQRKLAAEPLNPTKLLKKVSKHTIFFAIAFAIGNIFLAYVIGKERLFEVITQTPANNPLGFTAVMFFSGLFYLDFAFLREQFCHYICPYGRFQSVLVDKNTVSVTYDIGRGEPRGRLKKRRREEEPVQQGDCIDCYACVDVCPDGIDIRNGIQLECVQCTACIDACDSIMEKVGKPKGLIRYTTYDSVTGGEKFKVTPRMYGYGALMVVLAIVFSFALINRADTESIILRSPGTLYQTMSEGNYSNIYTYTIINKTFDQRKLEIRLMAPEGEVQYIDPFNELDGQSINEGRFFVKLNQSNLSRDNNGNTPIRIGIFEGDRLLEEINSTFIGPENDGK